MTNTFSTSEIVDLINKYLRNCLKKEERGKLQTWLNQDEDNLVYFKKITSAGVIEKKALDMLNIDMKAIRRKFHARWAEK